MMLKGDAAMLKLMTLINVSAAKPNKRKHAFETSFITSKKGKGVAKSTLNARSHGQASLAERTQVDEDEVNDSIVAEGSQKAENSLQAEEVSDDEGASAGPSKVTSADDAFYTHFASEGDKALAPLAKGIVGEEGKKASEIEWESSSSILPGLGQATINRVKDLKIPQVEIAKPHASVLDAFKAQGSTLEAQAALVNLLGSYQDVIDTHVDLYQHDHMRRAIALHAISHIIKTRRRVLRNNDRLAKAATTGHAVEADVRDQGFTRPKVLILLPLRNSALAWMNYLSKLSTCSQIENAARFKADFTLPEGTVDKLAQPETQAKYPADHIETFKGNIDDNFRIGAKMTRKSWKMYSQFYDSDVILASPLGLRLAIEKDHDSDFLSSIEVMIIDQADVMTMQNLEHLEFVLNHVNKIPKEAHDADFSRIKQWYLDGLAPYLRQTVMLSSFDSPELRKLSRISLLNVAGKVQLTQSNSAGVLSQVRSGIRQTFQRFPCNNIQVESKLRLELFLTKTLQTLQKSALSSSRTLIFVPSYLDFVQLQEALRTQHPEIFAVTAMLTEYSDGPEISRARARFITEKKKFLIVTERFMFYRRYILRGARTIVWYGLPDHGHYYSEMLENVFKPADKAKKNNNDEEETVDAGDISVIAIFSQYDYLKLERIVGSDLARRMVREEKSIWRFA